MKGLLEGFEFSSGSIDWSDEDLDSSAITRELVGSCSHWRPENRPGWLVGLSRLQVEVLILRRAGWRDWDGEAFTGKPYWRHMLCLIRLMFPRTDIHPDLADGVRLFCESIARGGKGLNLIGSQNCLGESERVLMFGGGSKAACDVRVGDLLVGPDSGPRRVLTTCSGTAGMFRVVPKVGRSWLCTGNHLVTVSRDGGLTEFSADDLSVFGCDMMELVRVDPDHPERSAATPFDVESAGEGRYAGFEVDGDNRFLLEDGTITHNSGKTSLVVRIAFAVMAVFPREAAVYFANPFDSASDSTIWGEVEECFDEVEVNHPGLFPDAVKYALRQIDLVPGVPKAGTMEIRNVKAVGKFKGTKTRKTGDVEGIILVGIDEVNEIYNFAFKKILSNITSQEGLFVITSQNYKDPGDLGGQLTTPKRGSVTDLDVHADHVWESVGANVTYRLCGTRSPNILAGRTIYNYLFTERNRQHIVDTYGEESPEYYSQVLSFPMDGTDANSVMSQSRLRSSRHDDPHFEVVGQSTRVAFCDPSFGRGDEAVYGWAEFGQARIIDGAGSTVTQPLIQYHRMSSLQIRQRAVVDQDVRDRLAAAGVALEAWPIGKDFPAEDQIALRCAELNRDNGVSPANFGYDFSMRPDIVMAMTRVLGPSAIPFDYNTKPLGYQIESLRASSEDVCRNRVDELAFITTDIFANRAARTGGHLTQALLETCRTRYEIKHGRRIVEKKRDYKARWQNKSPDSRDTLWGINGMAYLRGFRVTSTRNQSRVPPGFRLHSARSDHRRRKFRARKGQRLYNTTPS